MRGTKHMPVTSRNDRSHISLRMDPELLERIDAEAQSRMVSRTWLIDKAMRDWLNENADVDG